MIGLWQAYKALSGLRAMAVNAGIGFALLAALWGAYKVQVWRAEKRGASHAIEKIELDNRKSDSSANEADRRLDACYAKGLEYNRKADRCE